MIVWIIFDGHSVLVDEFSSVIEESLGNIPWGLTLKVRRKHSPACEKNFTEKPHLTFIIFL
jgi:hypothetical protein